MQRDDNTINEKKKENRIKVLYSTGLNNNQNSMNTFLSMKASDNLYTSMFYTLSSGIGHWALGIGRRMLDAGRRASSIEYRAPCYAYIFVCMYECM